MRRLSASICIVLLLGAAAGIIARAPWHGPIILSLSSEHGIDAGDFLAFPLVALAIAVWRRQARRRVAAEERSPSSRRWAVPASAIVLGVLLLFAGFVAKAGGGPLVPDGGGTFDGTIRETSGTSAVPVDRWSHVALTYDGSTLRLYVDGQQASSRVTTGSIQTPASPLWIGGNRPYGENFGGLIDEVRVYDRALGRAEIREDMATPVKPANGLVAAYGFDAGSGRTASDSSGDRNAGTIRRATWTRGRYGNALSFDGSGSVVRVPASASLDVTRAMTLSGWIRPSTPQAGWRTIVQRQADAYLLTASSDRANRIGWLDDVRAALVAAAAICFCLAIATGRGLSDADPRRSWWVPVALFMLGSIGDAALAPSGTLIGPTLVALWLGATASSRAQAVSSLLAAAVLTGLTIASLTTWGGVDGALSRDDGAIARTTALGALFVLAGLQAVTRRRHQSGLRS
jgi:hypothetical protein